MKSTCAMHQNKLKPRWTLHTLGAAISSKINTCTGFPQDPEESILDTSAVVCGRSVLVKARDYHFLNVKSHVSSSMSSDLLEYI